MNATSQINPGANTKKYNYVFRQVVSRVVSLLQRKLWRAAANAIVTEPSNWVRLNLFNGKFGGGVCNICGYQGPFVHLFNEHRIAKHSACPICDSRSRHRGLWFLYQEHIVYRAPCSRILHFAPEPVFYDLLRNQTDIKYYTTDFFLADVDYRGEDIQNLSFEDGSFDIVLCNHVLEHVADDKKAIREIHRILRSTGMAIITIPGDYAHENTVIFDRLDSNGHYRHYGLDVVEKIKEYFVDVKVKDLSCYNNKTAKGYLIRKNDMAFLCYKEQSI